jgi:outer membrane cobalamin receptor
VDVLNDGGAALYGSDAIAGVFNLITCTDQRGLASAGDFRIIDGSDEDWLLSSSYGNRFGNLNVFLSSGYQHRSPLQAIKHAFTRVTFLENSDRGLHAHRQPRQLCGLGHEFFSHRRAKTRCRLRLTQRVSRLHRYHPGLLFAKGLGCTFEFGLSKKF